jgi:choline dehydrogenase-like flavoprotein
LNRAVVVGSGAGGAAAARRLAGRFDVTVLEEGSRFRPFSAGLRIPEVARKAGLLFDEREISILFPAMRVHRAQDGMVIVRGRGTGGTTTIATANALRLDDDLRRIGIDLDESFSDLRSAIPVTDAHESLWQPATVRLFQECREMGLEPYPTPKMGRFSQCRNCGRCVLGCRFGVKWDSRAFLGEAISEGARLVTGARVERLVIRGGLAIGVTVRVGLRRTFVPADVVVLAAGGLGTPGILRNSGIPVEPRLFVDPVLCVAAPFPGANQNRELPMPFIASGDRYIVSPYFDHLSYFFNRSWNRPADGILSLMIKLADTASGTLDGGRVEKGLSRDDRLHLAEAVELCTEIFARIRIPRKDLFLGTVNAGHPGGMLPLTPGESAGLHHVRLPGNVFVADSSLFPASLGKPPMLTIMALADTVAKKIP